MMLNKKNLKKGVSLITVLMFMLVATIAATATYKWLTSENVSSASRMQTARAQQAAVAGLVTAKSWMAYHGNETGAIITQFMASGKKPIHLNSIIKASDTSMVRDSMKYDVWLIGANTSKQPYTLKLASKGFDGNSGAYTEIGIFDVAGLYRINVPQAEEDVQLSSYKQALFGQSEGITGSDYLQSGIINGDFTGSNVPVIDDDMLITGNFSVQGGTGLGNNLYVKGSYSNRGSMYIGTNGVNNTTCKPGSDTTIVYIGGNMESCDGGVFHVCGDMYVGGNISYKCKIKVTGNMTIGGTLSRNNEAHGFDVGKYLIFEKSGKIDQGSNAGPGEFKVGKGVLLSNGKMSGNLNGYTMNLEDLWKYSSSNVSFNNIGANRYEVKPSEGGGVLFNANVSSQNVIQNLNDLSENNSQTSAKLNKAGYWANRNRMKKMGNKIDPSTNKVPDPIILQDENVWKNKTMNASCGLGDRFKMDDAAVDKLNNCYASLSGKEDKLYNGFLVVKWVNSELQSVNKALNGKFVFYVDGSPSQTRLPRTTPGSVVMLYLLQGMNSTFQGDSGPSNYPMNYFIYSKGDIREIQSLDIHGGVMMANNSTLKKYQNSNKLQYDDAVVSALMLAGFIKSNPEFEKRAGGSGAGGGQQHQQHQGEDVLDSVYIAVAPQLRISLRTEYKNKEFDPDTVRNGDTVKPSILVLPRILYLPKDPRGKITDYFDVINLNGAHEEKNVNKVSCDPNEIPLNGKLYVNNTQLSEGIYTCKYNGQGYGEIPFYIVVNGNDNAMSKVRFENTSYEVREGQSVQVKIIVEGSNGNPMSVDVYQDNTPLGWTVTGPNSSYVDGQATLYKVPLTGTGTYSVGAFTVKAGTGASISSGVNFQLQQPCVGCKIGTPDHASVFIMGTFKVERKEIEEFCAKGGHETYCNSDEYKMYKDAPSCNNLLKSSEKNNQWVIANGNSCSVEVENNKWECNTLIYSDVHLDKKSDVNSTLCQTVIPPKEQGNAIYSVAKINEIDTLYASLKRKAYDLNVSLDGAKSTASKVHIYYKRDGQDSVELGYCTKDKCYDTERKMDVYSFRTFAGDSLFLTAKGTSDDKFRFWTIGNDESYSVNVLKLVVGEDYSVIANYNKEDAHCFYEDFDKDSSGVKFGSLCVSSSFHRCIDVCNTTPAAGTSCSFDQARYWGYGTKEENPNWVMVYNANSPVVDNGGYIHANTSGQSAVVLSTKENGSNGVLTSAFMSDVSGVGMINSGFVFRSNKNATEYYSVSVYGKSDKSRAKNVSVVLCRVAGLTADKSKCKERSLSVGDWGLSESEGFTDLTKINMVLTVKNADVSVELKMDTKSTGDAMKTISFNLRDEFGAGYEYNDANHSHVGFKLTDPNFRIFDISWISYDYGGKACWDYPRLMCSFKSNYAGSVPHNTFVKPWVAISSFVPSKDYSGDRFEKCKVRYYYNGCDNEAIYVDGYAPKQLLPNLLCDVSNNILIKGLTGAFWDDGRRMLSDSYVFTDEGAHGYNHAVGDIEGIARDAKVSMECPTGFGSPSSLSVPQSCGEFNVGNISVCQENRNFLGLDLCTSVAPCLYTAPLTANVRDAQIKLKVVNKNNVKMSIYMIDAGIIPRKSKVVESNADGDIVIDAEDFMESGFDIEHVATVAVSVPILKSVKVQSIESVCPNAVSAGSCSVMYNGSDWIMHTNVQNATRCAIGLPFGSKADTSDLKGSCSKVLQFPERNNLNSATQEMEYSFKLYAYREKIGSWSESDVTSCSYKIAPVNISCSPVSSVINVGETARFNYTLQNCPNGGCVYDISVPDNLSASGGPVASGTYQQEFGPMMTPGVYPVTINSMGKSVPGCTTIEVKKKEEKASCSYKDGKFSANITNDGSSWNGSLSLLLDNLGHVKPLRTYTNKTTSSITETLNPTEIGAGGMLHFILGDSDNPSDSCDIQLEAKPIFCPSDPITVGASQTEFKTQIQTYVCGAGTSCTWTSNDAEAVTFNNGEVSIKDGYGDGLKTYNLTLAYDGSKEAKCDVYAKFTPSLNCPTNVSEVKEGEAVKLMLNGVKACRNSCTYGVNKNGSAVASGAYSDGSEISFIDNNGHGMVNYTLELTNSAGLKTSPCTFGVTYKAASSAIEINEKNVNNSYNTGSYTIKVNGGTVYGCQINCNGQQGIVVKIGSETLRGDWYVGGNISLSNCSAATTLTVNQNVTCNFNWW